MVIVMQNNYSGLINFEVRTSSSKTFLKKLTQCCMCIFSIFVRCKHDVTWGVRTLCWVL